MAAVPSIRLQSPTDQHKKGVKRSSGVSLDQVNADLGMIYENMTSLAISNRVATHLENGEKSGENVYDKKVREINENLSKKFVLANVLENVYIVHFISIFCRKGSLVLLFAIMLINWSQGKTFQVRENSKLKLMATMSNDESVLRIIE